MSVIDIVMLNAFIAVWFKGENVLHVFRSVLKYCNLIIFSCQITNHVCYAILLCNTVLQHGWEFVMDIILLTCMLNDVFMICSRNRFVGNKLMFAPYCTGMLQMLITEGYFPADSVVRLVAVGAITVYIYARSFTKLVVPQFISSVIIFTLFTYPDATEEFAEWSKQNILRYILLNNSRVK